MSESVPRAWSFQVDDMTGFAEKGLIHTSGLDQAAIVRDERTYDATLRNLELIGEAASRIPADVRALNPDIQVRRCR